MKSIKQYITWKKAIAIALLLACFFSLLMNSGGMLKTVRYLNEEEYLVTDIVKEYKDKNPRAEELSKNEIIQVYAHDHLGTPQSMIGNTVIEQEMTAMTNRISTISLFFSNPARYKTKGKIFVSVKDGNEKVIAQTELTADMIKNDDFTAFSFNGDTQSLNERSVVSKNIVNADKRGVKIKKGEKYRLVVEAENVISPNEFQIFGEKKSGDAIMYRVAYKKFLYLVFAFFCGILFLTLMIVITPLPQIERYVNQRRIKRERNPINLNRKLAIFCFYFTPFISYFIIFKIDHKAILYILRHLFTVSGALNFMLIALILWVFLTIINRYGIAAILTQLLIFAFGFINYLLLIFRNSPLLFNDILLIKTATQVADTYVPVFNKDFLWALILSVCWIAILLSLREEKGFVPLKRRVVPVAITAVLIALTIGTIGTGFLEQHDIYFSSFKPKKSYKKNGYLLGFATTIKCSFVKKPEKYNLQELQKVTSQYRSDQVRPVSKVTSNRPNIIVVMNEAYSDLGFLGDLKTNKDYMPYFHGLKKNTIKGTMHTSVYGGHTANTEFEFLTGDTIRFLPVASVPYRTLIRKQIPSLAWALREQGYAGNIAFHPGMVDSYSRDIAYPHLGFATHLSLENLPDVEKIRSYVSDKADYEVVEKNFEKTRKTTDAPFFMFNVTIQNHGGYFRNEGIVEPQTIKITQNDQADEEATQFLNLMKISDQALKDLIEHFEKVKEPTVIVLFGDHQPKVGASFYEALLGKSEDELLLEETEKKYRVPFMIWANYDIPERDSVEISTNYLASYLMKVTGGALTGYDKYLLDLYEEIPVLTNICYIDHEGNMYGKNATSKYTPLIEEYEKIQYNGLIDSRNRLNEFFYLKQ